MDDRQARYNKLVAENRAASYEERVAKHQANVAEAAKRWDNPSYNPVIDYTAYLQPEIVHDPETGDTFLINAEFIPAGETVTLCLRVNGQPCELKNFCPHYPYELMGAHISRMAGESLDVIDLTGATVVRESNGLPQWVVDELGLHLDIWRPDVTYAPRSVVLHQGRRYLKLDDGDNSMPDTVDGGWELL